MSVISAFGTPGTREYSLISAFGTPGTINSEYSLISAFGTPGTRKYPVISAFGTPGTERFKMAGTRESLSTNGYWIFTFPHVRTAVDYQGINNALYQYVVPGTLYEKKKVVRKSK